MAYFTKNTQSADAEDFTELLPATRDPSTAQIVFPEDEDAAPTRDDLAYGYAQQYLPAQNGGYLGQALTPDQISYLMGPQALPTPRALVKVHRFFAHAAQSPLAPGAGVLTLAGLSVWAHGEPYHPLIGGCIIAVGGLLIRSAVKAHRVHGTDADEVFTKGAAVAGLGTVLIGTGVTAGLSRWEGLAVGVGTLLWYGVRAAVKRRDLEKARGFTVGLVAAGNTGPALSIAPPPTTPWGGQVSDEEYRLRRAFGRLNATEVILSPVRRANGQTWSVYANLVETKLTPDDVVRAADKIAAHTGARRVEVIVENASQVRLVIHDGDDPLAEGVPWPGPRSASILDPIAIGRFEDGTEAQITLAWRNTLVAGTTGGGKSGVVNAVLCGAAAAQDVIYILTDCKEGAPEFRAYRDIAFTLAATPEEGMRVLAGLEAVYKYRGQFLVEQDVAPEHDDEIGRTVRKWRPEFGPFILAGIDELFELTSNEKGAAARIQSLRATWRFVGMFAVDSTQTPAKEVFGGTTTARLNYPNRIGVQTAEQGATNIIFGQGMHGRGWRLDTLDQPGKMLIMSGENRRPRIARAYLLDDDDIARTVAQYRGRRIELDQGSADAFWEGYHAYGQDEDEETDGGGGAPRGGRRREPIEDAPAYGRPRLVVVPTYPDGSDIDDADRALWQLLGEFGRDGATIGTLAARAKALKHRYNSPPWVGGRLKFWKEAGYVDSEKEGREGRHWRKDLRSEVIRGGASA